MVALLSQMLLAPDSAPAPSRLASWSVALLISLGGWVNIIGCLRRVL